MVNTGTTSDPMVTSPEHIVARSLPQASATNAASAAATPSSDGQLEELPADLFDERPALRGLYLHVPFCFHKCHYCDFYSVVDGPDRDRQAPFTQALIRELDAATDSVVATPETLFVGGGTPTLLRENLWCELLTALGDGGWLSSVREFTVEANPETIRPELAERLRAGGVNRMSVGAQSFDPDHLKTLERHHDPANVARAVSMARSAGIANVNLDLIFGIPGQTVDDVHRDLDHALALEPNHLSIYGLTYEPNTKLTARRDAGQIAPADESLERAMYEVVLDTLIGQGWDHYEVSNFAHPADTAPGTPSPNRCAHNLLYWTNAMWLGCGPGAASHIRSVRWKNQPALDRYINGSPRPPVTQIERLDDSAHRGERLMLGLRLIDGLSESEWHELSRDDHRRQTEWARMEAHGFVEQADGRRRLTRRGLFVADRVIGELM